MNETRSTYIITNPFDERVKELRAYHGERKSVKNTGNFTFFVTERLMHSGAIIVQRVSREN